MHPDPEDPLFHIGFIRDEPESLSEFLGPGAVGLRGEIRLGDHTEEFVALLGVWGREEYESHWRDAAARLVYGADRTAFFSSAFEFRWTMWRQGDTVVVQEHFLEVEGFPEPFDPRDLYAHIRDLSTRPEDRRSSEWTVPSSSFADFLSRLPPAEG